MGDETNTERVSFVIRLCHGINNAIRREEHFWKLSPDNHTNRKFLEEFRTITLPALIGSAIVTTVAVVENEITRTKKGKKTVWAYPSGWYGKDEYENFAVIRHCFAHAAGGILPNRKAELTTFLTRLEAGNIEDHAGREVKPYYKLENGWVVPSPYALDRVRILTRELLHWIGLE